MHEVIGKIDHARDKLSNKNRSLGGKTAPFKDRRKNKYDRRKSVRDGVFVSFSFENDRRVLRDRRKAN